jgi:hypothetical protein
LVLGQGSDRRMVWQRLQPRDATWLPSVISKLKDKRLSPSYSRRTYI